jgi:hypothetical protein
MVTAPPPISSIRQRIVDISMAEIGYAESPPNSNMTKYGEWFGLNGVKWCGIFCSWVYAYAGHPLGNIGYLKGFAGCQTAVKYYRERNMITKHPKPGDLMFFNWKGNGVFVHTGIFTKYAISGIDVYTVEGNTSNKNQTNGGQVMQKVREVRPHHVFVNVLGD